MKEADLFRLLNSGKQKYSVEELKTVIQMLKRLAEIEYQHYYKTLKK